MTPAPMRGEPTARSIDSTLPTSADVHFLEDGSSVAGVTVGCITNYVSRVAAVASRNVRCSRSKGSLYCYLSVYGIRQSLNDHDVVEEPLVDLCDGLEWTADDADVIEKED